MTNTEKIFSLFINEDVYNQAFARPFELNGKVYATDGHIMIRTDKKNIDFKLQNPIVQPPNAEKVIPEKTIERVLKVDAKKFEALKTADETKHFPCKTCNGDGEVEWEFDRWTKHFDCPECDGAGGDDVRTGKKTFDSDTFIKISDAYFTVRNFYKLIEVSQLAKRRIFLLNEPLENKACFFKVGVFEVLLMPYLKDGITNYHKIITL